ncbi:nuclear transport factor 2 family protein [Emcibacter sp.]|uniref:nuclear transport factor 2 family protein n=1 Tax=Emcibacter sp. TaxID=1979954 RepID=UPI002AA8AF20|nr:nuclear transport factor 2 family protein [Emcibacter sp.]
MNDTNLVEILVALEQRLLEVGAVACADTFTELLHDDFMEIGKSGRRFVKSDFPEPLTGPAPEVTLCNPELKIIAGGLALLIYQTSVLDPEKVTVSRAQRSSLWQLTDGRWQIVFHQGTPLGEAKDAPGRSG